MSKKIRAVAIYLPQFHPIPENDLWWGKGFTEWTNVVKAKPLFKNHYQPHLPADLGFYDLRLKEVREAQAALAKDYNISGFCYYHYWFNGKKILERPFQEVFNSGSPDFPFMLCWANENWTRVWDGESKSVLLKQEYSEDDDRRHIRHLIPYFKDCRYIKVDGRPVIAIYKSGLLPSASKTISVWREEAKKAGLELYICRFDCHEYVGKEFHVKGFDAAIDFQPFGESFKAFKQKRLFRRGVGYLFRKFLGISAVADTLANRVDYEEYVDFAMSYRQSSYKLFPGIAPMWDNSARKRKNYFLFKNSRPEIYSKWLNSILEKFDPFSEEENFIFINAWNEWAEGNHLEPCQKWGRQYLEVTKKSLEEYQ